MIDPPACKDQFKTALAEHEAAGRQLVDAAEDGVQGAFTFWNQNEEWAYREMFVIHENAPPDEVKELYKLETDCVLPNGKVGHHYRGKVPVVREEQHARGG
jgi:hypothetical protein